LVAAAEPVPCGWGREAVVARLSLSRGGWGVSGQEGARRSMAAGRWWPVHGQRPLQ